MAWTAGANVATGDLITAATWNNYLGAAGSIMETAPAIVTAAGDLVYATAANNLDRLPITNARWLRASSTAPHWQAYEHMFIFLGADIHQSTDWTNIGPNLQIDPALLPTISAADVRLVYSAGASAGADFFGVRLWNVTDGVQAGGTTALTQNSTRADSSFAATFATAAAKDYRLQSRSGQGGQNIDIIGAMLRLVWG